MNAQFKPRHDHMIADQPVGSAHDLVRVGAVRPAVVAVRDAAGAQAEHLRAIAMRLMAGTQNQRARCMAVVSPRAGDGRSVLAANLAAIFAQAGRRTLLIDADLRGPCQHKLFQREAGPGLVALLRHNSNGYIGQLVEDVPGLYLITAGEIHTPGAAASLAGERFAELLEYLQGSVDQIVIDTPAGGAHPEAEAIAARAGAALMLVRRNQTRVSEVARLTDNIRTAGAHVVGSVVSHR